MHYNGFVQLVTQASNRAAAKRTGHAHTKYQGIVSKLPSPFTVWDVMKATDLDHPNAVQLIKRMRAHGLVAQGERVPQHWRYERIEK